MSDAQPARAPDEKISLLSSLPFFAVHAMCLFAFAVGFRWIDLAVCLGLYYVRMWAVTAGYHRYFSHRAFKTGRVFQFILALVATTSSQKGVLWWAAHHRHHHKASDRPDDIHSPLQRGFWWSHVGWILCAKYNDTRTEAIRDFARFPELRALDRFWIVPPVALAVALYLVGGFSMLVWGFFVSTALLWHGTFTINSLSHVFGKRRYKTTDTSRNNWLLALITCGEGWHNNHHYHQNTANQGWFWWEVDLTYYTLRALSWVGVVSDLRLPSKAVRLSHLKYTDADRALLREGLPILPARRGEGALAPAPAPAMAARVRAASEKASEKVRDALNAATDALPSKREPALEPR